MECKIANVVPLKLRAGESIFLHDDYMDQLCQCYDCLMQYQARHVAWITNPEPDVHDEIMENRCVSDIVCSTRAVDNAN